MSLPVSFSASSLASTPAVLRTQGGTHALRLRVARGFFTRLRGLMFAAPLAQSTGLLITRCTSVHTCFMRYALDLVYLAANGEVTQCVSGVKPWRWSISTRGRGTRHVLELPAGSIAGLGIRTGDRLLGDSAT
jgi:uncharacterized membrane protein (UPF0127 family)